jgi:hypothetical protein
MRVKRLSPELAAVCTAALVAGGIGTVAAGDRPAPGQEFAETVYLDARTLGELRASNPDHYARATRILAAANHLCRPHVPEAMLAQFRVQDFSCVPMLLLTSLPPQREIGFRLDHTRYIARVYVTDDPPWAVPVR